MPPFGCSGFQHKLIGVVEMNGYHQAVPHRIGRQYEILYRQVDIGHITRHAQITLCIVSARSAHSIHKYLVPFVQYSILFTTIGTVVSPTPSAVVDFVHRLEYQEVSFIPEAFGYLCPHCFQLDFNGFIYRIIGCSVLDIQPILAIRPVMVNIDNRIQACIFGIAYHFRHPVQVIRLNRIIGSFSNMP